MIEGSPVRFPWLPTFYLIVLDKLYTNAHVSIYTNPHKLIPACYICTWLGARHCHTATQSQGDICSISWPEGVWNPEICLENNAVDHVKPGFESTLIHAIWLLFSSLMRKCMPIKFWFRNGVYCATSLPVLTSGSLHFRFASWTINISNRHFRRIRVQFKIQVVSEV